MVSYKLTRLATLDIADIYKFGSKTFGAKPTQNYITSLEKFFIELSSRKEIARDASVFRQNLKFYNFKSHVVFYEFIDDNSIRIIRILGNKMDFIQHL